MRRQRAAASRAPPLPPSRIEAEAQRTGRRSPFADQSARCLPLLALAIGGDELVPNVSRKGAGTLPGVRADGSVTALDDEGHWLANAAAPSVAQYPPASNYRLRCGGRVTAAQGVASLPPPITSVSSARSAASDREPRQRSAMMHHGRKAAPRDPNRPGFADSNSPSQVHIAHVVAICARHDGQADLNKALRHGCGWFAEEAKR
jgi:hypothetical protein